MKVLSEARLLASADHRRAILSRGRLWALEKLGPTQRRLIFRGQARRCNLCDSTVRGFLPWGRSPDQMCPVCFGFALHRLLWFFLDHVGALKAKGLDLLHFAPEPGIGAKLRAAVGAGYLSADIEPGRAMLTLDLQAMDRPDASADVIVCSHVIEHVADPHRALAELRRVLRPSGILALATPWRDDRMTTGDPDETDPKRRVERFGQHDHFWRFGSDFEDAFIIPAGLTAEKRVAAELQPAQERLRLGLALQREPLFLCRHAAH